MMESVFVSDSTVLVRAVDYQQPAARLAHAKQAWAQANRPHRRPFSFFPSIIRNQIGVENTPNFFDEFRPEVFLNQRPLVWIFGLRLDNIPQWSRTRWKAGPFPESRK
jgi:hypothetical protein